DLVLNAAVPNRTVVINDSLTYGQLADVGSTAVPIGWVVVQAGPQQRPVLRTLPTSPPGGTAPTWGFTGGGDAMLTLDGLLVSCCDVVLRGSFDTVRITGCTLDPGTLYRGALSSPPSSSPLGLAVDGQPLRPTTLWIEADPAADAGSPPGAGTGAI